MCYSQITDQELVNLAEFAKSGSVEGLQSYLNTHPDFNINEGFYYGSSLLHLAVSGSHDEAVKMLLELGADAHLEFGNPRLSNYVPSAYENAIASGDQGLVEIFDSWSIESKSM